MTIVVPDPEPNFPIGGYTLSQLKKLLKRYGFDDSDPLAEWLNAALHKFEGAYDWPFLEVQAYVTGASGEREFLLPQDFFKPITIRDVTNNFKLMPWDQRRFAREVEDATVTGKPELYVVRDVNRVQFYRTLDSDVIFEFIYQKNLQDLVNETDRPDIPPKYHYVIVEGAAAIALQAENEEERSQTALNNFEDGVLRCLNSYSYRDLDEPEQVVDAQGYGETA